VTEGYRCNRACLLTVWLFCCLQVHLLVRGKQMRASKAMQDRVTQHSKVSVHLNTLIEDAYADPKGNMGGLILKCAETGACYKPDAEHLCG